MKITKEQWRFLGIYVIGYFAGSFHGTIGIIGGVIAGIIVWRWTNEK